MRSHKRGNTRLDLSPLDPSREPGRLDDIIRAAMVRIGRGEAPLPDMGPGRGDTIADLAGIGVRALIAASILAALAVGAGRTFAARAARGIPSYPVAQALGLPPTVAGWVEGGEAPTPSGLLSTMRGY
jgi:hypothetical protein